MTKQEYIEYLQSHRWAAKREVILTFWNNACAICNQTANLQVHHRTYDRVGNELLTDLICLCADCHDLHYSQMMQPPWEPIGPELRRYRQAIGEL